MKLTGLGTQNLVEIATDDHMRMDMDHLAETLDSCHRRKIPVLQVVGALGTTEFGTVDPIDRILEQRTDLQNELLHKMGQYILEGSKPGSTAAAVYVTHKVLPLDREGFGRLLGQTVHSSEYFFDKLGELRERLEPTARLSIPFPTDSNVLCLCVNPAANHDLAAANRFVRQLFSALKVTPGQPIQTKEYFVSYTSLERKRMGEQQSRRVLEGLNIDPTTFRDSVEDPTRQADHIFLLRHTLMNPWLLFADDDGNNVLDRYLSFLEELIRDLCRSGD